MERRLSCWRILVSAILVTALGQGVHALFVPLGMPYYIDTRYAEVWSKIMMPQPGPPPTSFMVYSAAFGFVSALLFVFVYTIIRPGLPGGRPAAKGILYGLLVFLLAGFPGALSLYLLINLPPVLIELWTAENFIIWAIGGLITGLLNR